ncbi:hypothetical protein ACIBKX_38185 [Streptomyces sp. NPDC050658]|uniref:hypothetical protein n=1 Tax=unclassified Streptomyces TaxID=2593676 RepID=UPI003433F71A
MLITEEGTAPGTALLIAAAPAGKGQLIEATSVLPSLAAVPPPALTGTAAATVVELADPLDPQTVLTRIRAAAATPGPLSLYVTGQLHLDHKQRLLHLALARTTPATLRYTGLPWHWLAAELRLRRPGAATTVVVDLVADAGAWERLTADGLALGHGVRLYGRIVPPPARRTTVAPDYLKACAAIWRSGAQPPLAQLHERAVAEAGGGDALLLAVEAPGPAVAGDPHPAILAAAHDGRHGEAASIAAMWESEALRTHGTGSAEALHWLEVRADLARLADDPARSSELWAAAAEARLIRQQPVDDPEVEAAVDRAHHQWEQVGDLERARALAPTLIALRRHVPGRRQGALEAVQRRLERLHGVASAATPQPPPSAPRTSRSSA